MNREVQNFHSPLVPSRQVREALSWRLVAEFHRRHPFPWTVIECHPGGGQYDCLTLHNPTTGSSAHLNRDGGFTPFLGGNAEDRIDFEELWPVCVSEGGLRMALDRMSRLCRLEVPAKLPQTGRETLTYRIMAGVITSLCLDQERWEWRNGQEDTSGHGCQATRDEWFSRFPAAAEAARMAEERDPYHQPKYRFWFLLHGDQPVLCVDKNALCWTMKGLKTDFSAEYARRRNLRELVGWTLAQIPPVSGASNA